MIGNNRTKNQLVGQMGIVKNATGLGGWHRVVSTIIYNTSGGTSARLATLQLGPHQYSKLRNALLQVLDGGGEEVRLQRNALTVISRPKGDETVRDWPHTMCLKAAFSVTSMSVRVCDAALSATRDPETSHCLLAMGCC